MRAAAATTRIRSAAVGGALLALVSLAAFAGSQPAEADTLPTLASEFFTAQVYPNPREGHIFTTQGDCLAGDSTFTFYAKGSAGGNFPGTFKESGSLTLGPRLGNGGREILAFESAFTIDAGTYTITGTKRLTETNSAMCVQGGEEGRVVNIDADLQYEAAITGPDGLHAVQGTAEVNFTDATPGTMFPDGWISFSSVFVTASAVEIPPSSVTLDPADALTQVGNEHCVTGTVRDPSGDPYHGASVRFTVTGASAAAGALESDANGEARFCYIGASEGTDTIAAHVDVNRDGVEDAGEPAATAAATFVPARRDAASLAFDPSAITLPVGNEHCLTATVRDAADAPLGGRTVRVSVTGASSVSAAVATDDAGEARFCYVGPTSAGIDTIHGYVDDDGDGTVDAGEPAAMATAEFVPVRREPASIALDPTTHTATVDAEHCVTATVRDSTAASVAAVYVRFAVSGASTAAGSAATDEAGRATFCYAGPPLPGSDTVRAFADTNGDELENGGEPVATAAASFGLPESTAGCAATFGGRVAIPGSGKATFGGNAFAAPGAAPRGEEVYTDHLLGLRVEVADVLALVCDGRQASIYGRATVNGGDPVAYRIRIADAADPGAGVDAYGILLATGYASGRRVLEGGNVQVRTP